MLNARGQRWFEATALPLPESFGFRKGLGTDDALFQVRRLDEEVSAWKAFGWTGAVYEAGLMDLRKAYPTANKEPFWHILRHHGVTMVHLCVRCMVSTAIERIKSRQVPTHPQPL